MKSLSHSIFTVATFSAAGWLGACTASQPHSSLVYHNGAASQAVRPVSSAYSMPRATYTPQHYPVRLSAHDDTTASHTLSTSTMLPSRMPHPRQLKAAAPYSPESAYAPYGLAARGHAGPAPRLRGFKPYGYGTYGASLYDAESAGVGIQARYGYQFNEFLALESEAATGILSFKNDVGTSSFKDKLDYQIGVFGTATLPLSPRFSVHTRGGYHETKLRHKTTIGGVTTYATDKDDGFAYGAGATLALTPKNALRLDVTKYGIPGKNIDAISLAYQTRF